jgi:hypothetical protein
MRSIRARDEEQEPLPLVLPEPGAEIASAGRSRRRPRGRRAAPAETGGRALHRLGSDALASRGLPAGTVLLVDTTRLPRRGQVLLVRVGGRLRVGVFEVELGRAVLRSDHETVWLDHTTEVWGVATVVDAPLDGMPVR